MPSTSSFADSPTAIVTGASGFIGSHLTCDLLRRGYHVRAAVRRPDDQAQNGHLLAQAKCLGAEKHLEIRAADLTDPKSLGEMLKGGHWVFHLAAVVKNHAPEPKRDIIDASLAMTENLLSALQLQPSIQGLTAVSSIVAVVSEKARPTHIFTEDDWYDGTNPYLMPYATAKTESERRIWDFARSQTAVSPLTVAVVNPTLVVGQPLAPHHVHSSLAVIKDLLLGRYRGAPPYGFGIVDVADVTQAMIETMERRLSGRFILSSGSLWLAEMIAVLKSVFPNRAIPDRPLPAALLLLANLLRGRGVRTLCNQLGRLDRVSTEAAQRELKINFRPARDSLAACAKHLEFIYDEGSS